MWKLRLEQIIYGLIYPAFFGNMIYDIINIALKHEIRLSEDFNHTFVICSLIIVFVIVDYAHLNADVNHIYNKPEYKSVAYFLCDLLTPITLFLSFVFLVKEKYFPWGIISFSIVPAIILIYKWSNPKSKIVFIIYAIASFCVGLAISVVENYRSYLNAERFFILSILAYSFYAFFYYPKYSRQFDLDKVKEIKEKLKREADAFALKEKPVSTS